ncbi:hypothetical protein GLAREA_12728 [Glarea lozoyensis ATCC 20868]|uniref:Uncharacterized protein n=1 Tax=Glarea lozoyensis (strain ATCC 20868 / MF5171) TaxID=1116229 RepID=S3D0P8_GLAL2|nr:uncharacterized protein GLAREA_12728 [Glarea lozoyensis ATCC 20868]EPE31425.1 hypothetical protein GLAREA_12728 [Glarea lozoyensis ATCC 20868]
MVLPMNIERVGGKSQMAMGNGHFVPKKSSTPLLNGIKMKSRDSAYTILTHFILKARPQLYLSLPLYYPKQHYSFKMQIPAILAILLAAGASARDFTLYEEQNFGGGYHREQRWNDKACWNMNGAGDSASSVGGEGCTTFYRERDCQGENWVNYGDAPTIPGFLDNHIWSFRNQCDCPNPFDPCQFAGDDGACTFGYSACLQKVGCGGRSGEFDCGGLAVDFCDCNIFKMGGGRFMTMPAIRFYELALWMSKGLSSAGIYFNSHQLEFGLKTGP